jgi:hypothetical protein
MYELNVQKTQRLDADRYVACDLCRIALVSG